MLHSAMRFCYPDGMMLCSIAVAFVRGSLIGESFMDRLSFLQHYCTVPTLL